jgi:hypothetical protein
MIKALAHLCTTGVAIGVSARACALSVLGFAVVVALSSTAYAASDACDPNYDPCVPVASDVDCASGAGNGPAYVEGPVQVIGKDIYGLDRDDNGVGCE